MRNPNREVFEYHGKHTAEFYNQFFNPNICHVCKLVDRGNLILCDQCCLISYCSEEHKTIHYPYHEKICAIIAQVLQVKPQQDTRRFNNRQQWIQSRKELMESIQEKLDDKMEPYMQQMILWSKSCYICHQQAELQVCQRCFSANYCDKHKHFFHTKHDGSKCDQLLLSLNIDIEIISGNTANISFGFLQFVNETSRFEEMLEFYMKYILMRRKRPIEWCAKDYIRSDYLSGPLTVNFLFKISELFCGLSTEYIIHILVANSIDINILSAWEILLHLVPNIQKLSIIMVGSELTLYSDKHNLCQRCTNEAKEFSYALIPMLYHDFVISEKYEKPNLVLGFHGAFNKDDINDVTSLKEIANQRSAIVLSASSKQEMENNIIKIKEAVGARIEPDIVEKNLFSGLAPHKVLETGDVYFLNEYLIIYYCLNEGSFESSTSSLT